jgi:hypothetical protein
VFTVATVVPAAPVGFSALGGSGFAASPGGEETPPQDFDPLPLGLARQPERPELPTERGILAGMEVARSLLTGKQPQANLVPQQQDTGFAVARLLPGEPDDGVGQASATLPGDEDRIELSGYMISPIAGAATGPVVGPWVVPPALDLAAAGRAAVEPAAGPLPGQTTAAERGPGSEASPAAPAPRQPGKWALALGLLAAAASRSLTTVPRKLLNVLPLRGRRQR